MSHGLGGNARGETEPIARTRTSAYHVRPDGIFVQTIVLADQQTLDDAKANTAAFAELADGRKRRLLVDMAVPYSTAPGVRAYYASEEAGRYIGALAMLTPSSSARVIGNFFLAINNPGYPCKMFGDLGDAVGWLLAQSVD